MNLLCCLAAIQMDFVFVFDLSNCVCVLGTITPLGRVRPTSLSPKLLYNVIKRKAYQVLKLLNAQHFHNTHTHTHAAQTIIKSHFNGYRFKLNALYVAFLVYRKYTLHLPSFTAGFKSDFHSSILFSLSVSLALALCLSPFQRHHIHILLS